MLKNVSDDVLLSEVHKRFEQKNETLQELEFLTKKLYDLNEKLRETDKVKGEFLSLIKNVFNNPMSSLLNLSFMMQKNSDSPKTQTMKALLDVELQKLNFQLGNIFTAAEIEAGEIGSYFSVVDVDALLDEVLHTFHALIEDKMLTIEKTLLFDEPIVSDAKKLNTILLNLISNACEYSFRGKTVYIKVFVEAKTLIFEIGNTGDVIDKEHKKEIFNRFKKADKKSRARESVEGLGLGLSVVNALVESLDGEIDYTSSEALTTFKVALKLQELSASESLVGESANEFMFDDFDTMKEF